MPSKEYRIWLSEAAYLVVDLVLARGELISFVVRLMLRDGDGDHNVARYDTAHGTPHLDIIGRPHGLLQKRWFVGEDLEVSLQRAIADLKLNYEDHIRNYLQN